MVIKVKELSAAVERGLPLLEAVKLKVSPSFWLGRQARRLRQEYNVLQTKRTELIKFWGEEIDPSGSLKTGTDIWRVRAINQGIFNKDFQELLESDIEIMLEQRPSEYLGEVEIEGTAFELLFFLFSDAEPPAPKEPPAK